MVRATLRASIEEQRSASPKNVIFEERIPTSLRLGPAMAPIVIPKPNKRFTSKKKLGRPPGKGKTNQKPPGSFRIPSTCPSKKRRLLKPQPSPRRKLNMENLDEAPALVKGSSQGQSCQSHTLMENGISGYLFLPLLRKNLYTLRIR